MTTALREVVRRAGSVNAEPVSIACPLCGGALPG